MTLEDFFTLTEMKDGLTATFRVEELVSVMQKEQDSVVNPGDAIRQWAAVTSIIAATDNKDCLDLFVQLGGLSFIARWLKDAENFGSNNSDNFVEESITALLLAIGKLCIDRERSISLGIWATVRHLLDHHNVKVQDRARAVFDDWNRGSSDAVCQQTENNAAGNDGPSVSGDVGRKIGEAENDATVAMTVESLPLQSPNVSAPESVEDVHTEQNQNQQGLKMVLDTDDGSVDPLLSSVAMSDCDQDGPSDDIKDVQMSSVEERAGVETCVADVPHGSSFSNSKADAVPGNAFSEDKKPLDKINSDQENLSSLGVPAESKQVNITDADALTSEEAATGSLVETKVDVDWRNLGVDAAAFSDLQVSASESEVPEAVEDNHCNSDIAESSHDKKPISNKLDDADNVLLSKEVGAAAKCKETVRDRYKEVSNLSALYGRRKGKKRSKKDRGKKSTIENEYGILDALDIARQVAKEVEREVIDYKDPYDSNSSDRSSGGRIGKPRSPDSINDSSCSTTDTSSDDVSTGQSQSAEGDGRSSRSSESKDPMEDVVESSHLTEAKDKTGKGLCEFDLNEELCPDDAGDKLLLNEEFHDSSSQGLKRLEIDLNMAEDGQDGGNFHVTENHMPVSSSVNSKGSSVEANQGRSERLNLDLNSTGDDDDDGDDVVVISDSGQFNGPACPSTTLSSELPAFERNFDLNDRPYTSFQDPFSDRTLYHNSPRGAMSLGKPKLDSFISIMGTKVEVRTDDLVPQRPSYLHNGKATFEASSSGSLGLGPAVSSLYSPLTRCSTLPMGHPISFSLTAYGPNDRTHCIADPRVGPVLPGAPGPMPALYSPYSLPFSMSLNAGPSRPQLDLNSGFAVDGTNQDSGFLMQLFPTSQVRSTGDHPGAFLQPLSGPTVGAKRKEPESGWEPYPIGFGQHQSPWK